MTLKINRISDSPRDYVCKKFGQNPLKDVDSRVFKRMMSGKYLTTWHLTFKINRFPDSRKDYVCAKFAQHPLKDVDSRVFTRIIQGNNLTRWHWPLTLWPWKWIVFQTFIRTKYVPSLVKIHWRVLILDCSQGCYRVTIWPGDIDLWLYDLENE